MAVKIQIRNGTASAWTSANPILAVGELAIENDTKKFKIGDGSTLWAALPYATQGETGLTGLTGKGLQYAWNGTQLGVRVEGDVSYTYVDLIGTQGVKGDTGNTGVTGLTGETGATGSGLEFNWSGTQLGVRVAGSPTYTYVELVGPQGIQGIPGADGVTPTTTNIGSLYNSATAKTTLVDADLIGAADSAASFVLKKWTFANLKTQILSYFTTVTTTWTNKRITKRAGTLATGTPAPLGDTQDIYTVTALAANVTVSAPTGTPTNGQEIIIRILDNGTARTLTWNAIYRSMGVVLPTTTVASKTMYCWFIYNTADSKWDLNQLNIDGVASGGGGSVIVEDLLTSTSTVNALSANQGKNLSDLVSTLSSTVDTRTQEACIVTVSTDDAQPVVGQIITLTNITDNTKSETYTLLTGETSHTFRVIQNQVYKISVNAKSLYIAPSESTQFTAVAGNIRNVSMQYLTTKRYGFRRERGNSNPATRITYLYDAVGLTPAYMDFTGGSFVYGGWSTFVNDVCRPVMLKTDGTVGYELSRTDLTKKADGVTASDVSNTAYDGNAMIEFGKYKWVYRYSDATYDYVIFSNVQYDANYKAYAHQNALGNVKDAFYWGAFKGYNKSSKLASFADQAIMVSQTRNTEATYATAHGSGYYTIYKSGWDFICDLLTLIGKSDNSQLTFGAGRSKTTNTTAIATGTLKTQPQFKGYNDETSDIKVFGIEGFYGNVWEGMAGLILNSGIKTKMTPPYNFDGTGYTATGITPSGTNGGYVSVAQSLTDQGYVPSVASGSATTNYCDGLWYNTAQVDYALAGGGWSDGLLVGSRCVVLNNLASAVYASLGSRLSFLSPA